MPIDMKTQIENVERAKTAAFLQASRGANMLRCLRDLGEIPQHHRDQADAIIACWEAAHEEYTAAVWEPTSYVAASDVIAKAKGDA